MPIHAMNISTTDLRVAHIKMAKFISLIRHKSCSKKIDQMMLLVV